MHTLDGFILEDDTEKVFSHLVLSSSNNKIVDIVMDNSGYELLSDLCLADFMVVKCSVKGVNFRVKRMPWFVSDVTPLDFSQAVYLMANHSDSDFKRVGVRWQNYLTSGVWKVYDDVFWTLGLSYGHMPEADPVLYDRLKQSHLILFKGDLNYRKLIQDYVWDPTVSFSASLGQFRPAPLLAIRTCKSDTVTGLKHGVAESAETKSKDWLISGEYAVVQFYTPL
ncbi:hypothetical protein AAG570_001294 [Ranatra chinensis]|uniref:Sugar phosphate phosphatase n=1 Tax=Ranatra chinensis TaxID=642074 RepID=A0ABD0YBH6_9HEMI